MGTTGGLDRMMLLKNAKDQNETNKNGMVMSVCVFLPFTSTNRGISHMIQPHLFSTIVIISSLCELSFLHPAIPGATNPSTILPNQVSSNCFDDLISSVSFRPRGGSVGDKMRS